MSICAFMCMFSHILDCLCSHIYALCIGFVLSFSNERRAHANDDFSDLLYHRPIDSATVKIRPLPAHPYDTTCNPPAIYCTRRPSSALHDHNIYRRTAINLPLEGYMHCTDERFGRFEITNSLALEHDIPQM